MAATPFHCLAAAVAAAALAMAPLSPAFAWTSAGQPSGIVPAMAFGTIAKGPTCPTGSSLTINKNISINKPITINKPVTINKSVTINKPVTITKNVNVYKPVTINKTVNISKTINNSKNIAISKTITINKGGSANASAFAFAAAAAQANASANVIVYGGNQYVTIANHYNVGGPLAVNAQPPCEIEEANVVKSIHAVCYDRNGRQYPASHMVPDTWIDQSYEGEIARCIPGATVHATVGDVLQSDQGLAGTYEHGKALVCKPGEALVHYRGGMLKCAPAKPVKDCTERENLRRWGPGDFFFSYRDKVCVTPPDQAAAGGQDLSGMTLEGGVGATDSGY